MKTIGKTNFFSCTFAVFKGCKQPKREPDFISYDKRTGKKSSMYWYGSNKNGNYVIRKSDHWTKINGDVECKFIASCVWELKYSRPTHCGKAYFSTFRGRG